MRKLISTLLLMGVVLITQIHSFAQTRDSLIQLYPGIGDTIYSIDKEYFELFQKVDGFEYAVFYIRDNKNLVSKVTYNFKSIVKDTISTYSLSELENIRSTIKNIDVENNKKMELPREVIIFTKDENQYTGLLDMFSNDYLYLFEESNDSEGSVNNRYKIRISEVKTVLIPGESNVLSSMLQGALAGFVIGGIAGVLYGPSHESTAHVVLSSGAVFGALGVVLGFIAGLVSSTGDILIKIDSQEDVLLLKNYAKYYFIYDEGIENSYAKIK